MNRETSVYLDFVRFGAAMVVFFGHLSGARFSGGLFWQFQPFMHEAVAVFFVLSGFVIPYSTERSNITPSKYVIDRAARLYSVVLPALCTTFMLDSLGWILNPTLYSTVWGYDASDQAVRFARCLFFVNELWNFDAGPGSMLSYWSLGFEVWYYIGFGLAFFTRGPMRIALLLTWAIIVGPMILMMLPLWLLGLVAYRLGSRIRLEPYMGAAAWGVSLAVWTVYEAKIRRYVPVMQGSPPQLSNVLNDYIVGGLFAVNVIGFKAMSRLVARIVDPVAQLIRYAAGATFTIYLLHIPVAQFLTTVIAEPPSASSARIVIFGGTLLALFLVASVTERQKHLWRHGVHKIYIASVRFEQ